MLLGCQRGRLASRRGRDRARGLKKAWSKVAGCSERYLDNNVVSAIAKNDHPAESRALDRLRKAKDKGKVDLVTSELTEQEIKRYQGPWRPSVERTFRWLQKVEVVRWDELVGIHSYGDARTWLAIPLINNYPEYGALLKLGLEVIDAQHVYVSGKQACDTFLTCDKGILRRGAGIKKIFPSLRVQRPSDFVASQEWSLAMTNHDDMPARFPALVWAVIFTILLVAAVAIFALVLIR